MIFTDLLTRNIYFAKWDDTLPSEWVLYINYVLVVYSQYITQFIEELSIIKCVGQILYVILSHIFSTVCSSFSCGLWSARLISPTQNLLDMDLLLIHQNFICSLIVLVYLWKCLLKFKSPFLSWFKERFPEIHQMFNPDTEAQLKVVVVLEIDIPWCTDECTADIL